MKPFLRICVLAAMLGACSGSGSPDDGGLADAVDAADAGGDDLQPDAGCLPADDEFEGIRMRFEPGAKACTGFHDFATWQSEVEMAGRLTFIPGTFPLEEFQPADVTADWIERLEVGQDKQEATKLDSALLWYEFLETGDPNEGCHRYHYEQPFRLDGEEFLVTGVMTFCLDAGMPRDPEICVGPDYSRGRLGFRGMDGEPGTNDYQGFRPCYYNHIPLWIISLQMENGDSLVLHKRFAIPLGGSGPARIVYAEGNIAGHPFQIDDPFRLVYAAEHHNWNQEYVVIFVPPLDDVHGLYTQNIEEGAHPGTLRYLDAELNELRTTIIADINVQGPL